MVNACHSTHNVGLVLPTTENQKKKNYLELNSKEKQLIITFEKMDNTNIWHFCNTKR